MLIHISLSRSLVTISLFVFLYRYYSTPNIIRSNIQNVKLRILFSHLTISSITSSLLISFNISCLPSIKHQGYFLQSMSFIHLLQFFNALPNPPTGSIDPLKIYMGRFWELPPDFSSWLSSSGLLRNRKRRKM